MHLMTQLLKIILKLAVSSALLAIYSCSESCQCINLIPTPSWFLVTLEEPGNETIGAELNNYTVLGVRHAGTNTVSCVASGILSNNGPDELHESHQ